MKTDNRNAPPTYAKPPMPVGPPITDKVVEAVRKDLLDRSTVGIAKYGTTLDQNNGDLRYWLQHQYEELLDAANYCKRAIMELDKAKILPIPENISFSMANDNFYDSNGLGMGTPFYEIWIKRANEFPRHFK